MKKGYNQRKRRTSLNASAFSAVARNLYPYLTGGSRTPKNTAKRVKGTNRKSKTRTSKVHIVRRDFEGGQGGTTKSHISIHYKVPKAVKMAKKLGNCCTHLQIRKVGLWSDQSEQQAVTVDYIAGEADLTTTFNDASRYYDTLGSGWNQQPITTNTAQSKKFLLKSVYSELRLVNQAPSTTEFEIYVLMCKNSSEGGASPEALWDQGLVHQAVGLSAMTHTTPYSVPTTSKVFNMHWKVVKKIKGSLNPGADHVNTFSYQPNRIIDSQYVNDYAEIKGITYAYMVVTRGKPGDDNDTYNPIAQNIGLCKSKLIGTVKNTYKVYNIADTPRSTTYSSNLDTAGILKVQSDVATGAVNTETAANIA